MRKFTLAMVIALGAGTAANAEVWEGTGKLLDRDGHELADYTVAVNVEAVEGGDRHMVVTVRNTEGQVLHTDDCLMHRSGIRWTKECTGGTSRGMMLGFGLGTDYYEAKNGKAYSTSITLDGDTGMRLLRVELEHGAATKFFAESLTKRSE